MSERLYIRLGKVPEASCQWLVWSEQEQEVIASGELANASELVGLQDRAAYRPVDILVPSAAVTLTTIDLPEKGQQKALKALPFMLEESIIDNVDEMHFVVGPRDGERVSVAAVANEQMMMWLEWLNEAGITARSFIPDSLALPLHGCDWAAMRFGQETLIRTGQASGQSYSPQWLHLALPQLNASGDHLSVATYTELEFPGLKSTPQQLEMPMLVLAKGVAQAPINLLSGMFKPQKEYGQSLSLWRNAVLVFVVAFVLLLIDKGINIYRAEAQISALQQQTQEVYRQLKPGSGVPANLIPGQLRNQLKKLQGQGGGNEFFAMLQQLKGAFAKVPALKPNSLRFDGNRGELRMQVTATTYAQIEQFKEAISGQFKVDAGAMNSSDGKVTGTLTLRTKSHG